MRVDLLLDKKLWKIKIGPPGLRAVMVAGRRGPWACGPSGRWAVTGRGPVFSKTLAESRQFKCNTSAKCVTVVQITHCNSGLWLVERLTNFVAQWYHVKQWHRPFTTKSDLNTNKQPPRIYGLLKIHKDDIPYHDLQCQAQTFAYDLSAYLADILSPLTSNSDFTVTNSVHHQQRDYPRQRNHGVFQAVLSTLLYKPRCRNYKTTPAL